MAKVAYVAVKGEGFTADHERLFQMSLFEPDVRAQLNESLHRFGDGFTAGAEDVDLKFVGGAIVEKAGIASAKTKSVIGADRSKCRVDQIEEF